MNPLEWLFTPLFNSNFVNCFDNQPCYQEPFGLLPMPISIIAGVLALIGWRKGWFKNEQQINREVKE